MENHPFLTIFFRISAKPTHVLGKSAEKGPLFRGFRTQNPPIWAEHADTRNTLCTSPGMDQFVYEKTGYLEIHNRESFPFYFSWGQTVS